MQNANGGVQNGPLKGAFAFLDAHTGTNFQGNGVQDAGEAGMATLADGSYSLAIPASGGYTFTAYTTADTIDTVTGTAYGAGITFKAPEGATKITPQTTMINAIVESTGVAVTAAAIESASTTIATAMGITLPAGETLASYDAYAVSTDPVVLAAQLKVQQANNNVMAVVKTMASAAEGAGVGASAASALAFAGMLDYVDGVSAAIDFSDNTQMTAIVSKQNVAFTAYSNTTEGTALSLNTAEFSTIATAAQAEIREVTTLIKALTTSSTAEDKAALFKVISTLSDTVEVYAKDVTDNGVGSATALAFDTAGQVANSAPTDIKLAGSTTTDATYTNASAEAVAFLETGALSVGVLTGVDTEDGATPLTYALSGGADEASFEIITSGTGASQVSTLAFKAQPDYETGKISYVVSVSATDSKGAKKIETFTINITDDTTESGGFGIKSDTVSWTDYQPATLSSLGAVVAGKDIANTVLTDTTGTAVAIGTGSIALNMTNLTNLTTSGFAGVTKSPNLKFELDSVPTGSGTATITARITDGSDATRTGTEDQISLTVTVAYTGDGTTGTLTLPAAGIATGTYSKGAAAAVSFNLANGDVDAYSITAANAVTGMPATLDVKMGALFDAFITGGGKTDMIQAGTYNVAIETTSLPLLNYANEDVTTFSANVELVTKTLNDTLTGTDGADNLIGGNTGQVIDAGLGKDSITLGTGADYVVLAAGDGNAVSTDSNQVTNFSDGNDYFVLEGSLGADLLTIEAGATSSDTLISITATSEYLMHVVGVANNLITDADFVSVSEIV